MVSITPPLFLLEHLQNSKNHVISFLLPSDGFQNEWNSRSIWNTPHLNILLSACLPPLPLWSALFYSWVQAEFNKYMQMCAAEHDEFKSVGAALWALVRLKLRADPRLIIFHFPIAFNSAAAGRACVRARSPEYACVSISVRDCVYLFTYYFMSLKHINEDTSLPLSYHKYTLNIQH